VFDISNLATAMTGSLLIINTITATSGVVKKGRKRKK